MATTAPQTHAASYKSGRWVLLARKEDFKNAQENKCICFEYMENVGGKIAPSLSLYIFKMLEAVVAFQLASAEQELRK